MPRPPSSMLFRKVVASCEMIVDSWIVLTSLLKFAAVEEAMGLCSRNFGDILNAYQLSLEQDRDLSACTPVANWNGSHAFPPCTDPAPRQLLHSFSSSVCHCLVYINLFNQRRLWNLIYTRMPCSSKWNMCAGCMGGEFRSWGPSTSFQSGKQPWS